MQNPWVFAFLNEGGEFWVERNSPSPRFYVSRCSGSRPGELTMYFLFIFYFFIFFCETQVCTLYGSTFAYSNPLRVDQASDHYLKDTTVIITGNLKDTRLPPSCASCLSKAEHGTTIHRSWSQALLASVPKYFKVGNDIAQQTVTALPFTLIGLCLWIWPGI